jgi:hypothetical protein
MARCKARRIGTIDCETDPFEPGVLVAPFLWGVYLDDGSYYEFRETGELVTWLLSLSFDLILYAHNGGKFDYHFLREYIESDEPISVIAGRLSRCKIGRVELRDSLNLFGQTKLADFSKIKFDYRKMKKGVRERPEIWEEIRTYLKDDCFQLFRLVSGFIEKFGMQFTQAGAAMKYWQKNYAPNKEVPHSTPAFYEKFSPFYFGGRVQCFQSGHARENFHVVDINSAYPFAMLSEHAYSCEFLVTSKLPEDERRMSSCLIELDAIAKGCFALRAEDGSLYFPEDERQVRRYFVTGWELLAALETNTVKVKKIRAVYRFGQVTSFREYVEFFFAMRQEAKKLGDKAQDIFAKIFLNALYGKWASNPTKYREFMLSDPDSRAYAKWVEAGYIDAGSWGERSMLVRPLPPSKHRYFNIVTAASITGYVRAHLWKSLQQVSRPLYCDTDSIAAGDVSKIDLGNKLGQWKHEMEGDEYAIGGKKLYAFHKKDAERPLHVCRQMPLSTSDADREKWKADSECWKLASKGTDLTPAQIIEVSKGGEFKYRSQVPNYSIHKSDFGFIDRVVRSTYKDISDYEAA